MVSHLDPRPDTRAWAETTADFYRRERPDAHFRTASSTSAAFADAVVAVLAEHPDVAAVAEVGAGTGTLLRHLHRRRPDLQLVGFDLRERPAGLDPAVAWVVGSVADGLPGPAPAGPCLLLACELLDDLPDPTRTQAWGEWLRLLRRHGGLALAVDYASSGPGPLLAYRDGQAVEPVLAPDRNLTSPVDLDVVRRAGEAVGARTLALLPQSAALARWTPAYPPVRPDPLAGLVDRSEWHALTSPSWLGSHWWLLQQVPRDLR